ncbi:DHH family phosphoesterase [bacterium]|nr:DHH family phosphoesterase [bacterium]
MSITLTLAEICSRIQQANTILVLSHLMPDADAVGSSAGLTRILKAAGKNAYLHFPEKLPQKLEFIVAGIEGIYTLPRTAVDLAIITDTASVKRLAVTDQKYFDSIANNICIDHHASNSGWAKENFIDAEFASTSEIILSLAETLGVYPLSSEIATALLAGVMDDTGSFRYSNTKPETYIHASQLVAFGASPNAISERLYFDVPERVFKLRARALSKVKRLDQTAYVSLTLKDLAETGCIPEDTDGIIDELRSISGVQVAVLIREMSSEDPSQAPGFLWKASLRSKREDIDVNKIAGQFGGGGHPAAAGCKMRGSLEQIEAGLLKAIKEYK